MHKIQYILSISALLFCALLQAKENDTILGLTTDNISAGTTINTDWCDEKEPIRIIKKAVVFIIGTKNCNSKYHSRNEKYYIVGYRGKIRYIKQNGVFLTKEGEKKLDLLKDENLAQLTETAIEDSKLMYDSELVELSDKLNKTKSSGVAILTYQVFDESEHTEGTGYKISYYNSTKKIIKYVTATVIGYNAVADPVKSTFNRNSILTLRGIGPIQPNESATYSKSYVWHTDTVESMKITSVKVEYMDGTSSYIKDPRSIILDNASYEFYNSID